MPSSSQTPLLILTLQKLYYLTTILDFFLSPRWNDPLPLDYCVPSCCWNRCCFWSLEQISKRSFRFKIKFQLDLALSEMVIWKWWKGIGRRLLMRRPKTWIHTAKVINSAKSHLRCNVYFFCKHRFTSGVKWITVIGRRKTSSGSWMWRRNIKRWREKRLLDRLCRSKLFPGGGHDQSFSKSLSSSSFHRRIIVIPWMTGSLRWHWNILGPSLSLKSLSWRSARPVIFKIVIVVVVVSSSNYWNLGRWILFWCVCDLSILSEAWENAKVLSFSDDTPITCGYKLTRVQ